MYQRIRTLQSLLSRLEKTGVVSYKQVRDIGAVGMAARMVELPRDVRRSHPYGLFCNEDHEPIIKKHGSMHVCMYV